MKCFVTGGTGHIGNVLIKKLVKLGHSVRALVLPNEDTTPIKDLPITLVTGDVTDREFLFNTIEEDEVVFHLAGVIEIAPGRDEIVRKVNVDGTKNIADVCVEKKLRLVYTSSVHTITPVNDVVLYEPTAFDLDKLVGTYAKTKAEATEYVFDAVNNRGLDAVVLYPSGVIGPCDYKVSELGQVLLDYINGKIPCYIQGGYNFVDVRDVADGIISAAVNGRSGEGYNLTGTVVSIKQMFEALNICLHKNYMPPKLPLWLVRIFAKISTFHYRRLGKKPTLSDYSLYTLNVNSNFSNEKAKQELNFNTRNYKKSLCDALKWFVYNKPELVAKKIVKKFKAPKTAPAEA